MYKNKCSVKVLLVVGIIFFPQLIFAQSAKVTLSRAEDYYKKAEFDSCIILLKKALPTVHENSYKADVLTLLAKAYKRNFQLDSSRSYLTKIIHDLTKKTTDLHQRYQHTFAQLLLIDIYALGLKTDSISNVLEDIDKSTCKNSKLYGHYLFCRGRKFIHGDSAKFYYREALRYFDPADDEIITTYIWLADLFVENQNFKIGLIYIKKAISHCKKYFPGDNVLRAFCYNELGFYYHARGDLKKALQVYRDSAAYFLSQGTSKAYLYLSSETDRLSGWSYQLLGDYESALLKITANLTKKTKILRKDHHKVGEANLWLGSLYYTIGMLDRASDYINKAVPIFNESSSCSYLSQCNILLGLIAFEKGQFNHALIKFELVKSLCPNSPSKSYYLIEADFDIALIFMKQNQIEQAIALLNDNIDEINEKMMFPQPYLAMRYYIKGMAYGYLDKNDEAKLNFKTALNIYDKSILEESLDYVRAINSYSYFLIKNGDEFEAISMLEKTKRFPGRCRIEYSQQNSDLTKYSFEHITTLYLLGKAYKEQFKQSKTVKDLNLAINYLRSCQKLVDSGRKKLSYRDDDLLFTEDLYQNIFKDQIDLVCQPCLKSGNHCQEVFSLIEDEKSLVLLHTIQSTKALHFSQISDTVLIKENSLREQITYLESKLLDSQNVDQRLLTNWKAELSNAKLKYDGLINFLEKNYPEYYNLKYNFDVLSIKEVQQKLKPNEALIEYFNGDEETYAFTLTSDTVFFETLPLVSEAEVENFRNTLSPDFIDRSPSDIFKAYTGTAYKLYQKALAPLLKHIDPAKINSLKIIPDGVMSLVPYETLLTAPADGNAGDYKSLPYLMKQFNISYGYSSTSLFKMTSKQTEYPNDGVLAFAPGNYTPSEETAGFNPLKWNKTEVNDLSNYFSGDILTGTMANEHAFKENIQKYPIAHLAMHAVVNNEDPMYSKLLFAPPQDTLEDGMLHTFELYNMRLNTQMVVLSACNTGYGKLQRGEGVMSLSRAFAYAGCPSVVMSHWAVDDKTTAELMKYFYQHLSQGESKDVALRNAKLDFLGNSSPLYQHPYFWNNFVVLGDTAPVKSNDNYFSKLLILFSVLAMTGIVFYWFRKRKRGHFQS